MRPAAIQIYAPSTVALLIVHWTCDSQVVGSSPGQTGTAMYPMSK